MGGALLWAGLGRVTGHVRGRRGCFLSGGKSLNVTHLAIDPFDNIVVLKQVGDDTKSPLPVGRGLEKRGSLQEAFSQ